MAYTRTQLEGKIESELDAIVGGSLFGDIRRFSGSFSYEGMGKIIQRVRDMVRAGEMTSRLANAVYEELQDAFAASLVDIADPDRMPRHVAIAAILAAQSTRAYQSDPANVLRAWKPSGMAC